MKSFPFFLFFFCKGMNTFESKTLKGCSPEHDLIGNRSDHPRVTFILNCSFREINIGEIETEENRM